MKTTKKITQFTSKVHVHVIMTKKNMGGVTVMLKDVTVKQDGVSDEKNFRAFNNVESVLVALVVF